MRRVNRNANMYPFVSTILSFIVICLAQSSIANADVWDLAADWSDTSNPNGVWSYNGSPAAPIGTHFDDWDPTSGCCFAMPQPAWALAAWPNTDHIPMWMKVVTEELTGAQDFPIGRVIMHGAEGFGPPAFAGVTWTSPVGGVVNITGGVWLVDVAGNRSMDWAILLNGMPLTSGSLTPANPFSSVSPFMFENGDGGPGALTQTVAIGDVVTVEFTKVSSLAHFVGVDLTISEPESGNSPVIQPDRGGNSGEVSIEISGASFTAGSVVKLIRLANEIVGAQSLVSGNGRVLTARFDLRGSEPGQWELVIEPPLGQAQTLQPTFEITSGGVSDVWVDVIGLTAIRTGSPQSYFVSIGNRGDIDAVGVPIWIAGIPDTATVEMVSQFTNVPVLPDILAPSPELDFPLDYVDDGERVMSLVASRIGAGESQLFEFKVTVPVGDPGFTIRSWASEPLVEPSGATNTATLNPIVNSLRTNLFSVDCITSVLRELLPPGAQCIVDIGDELSKALEAFFIDVINAGHDIRLGNGGRPIWNNIELLAKLTHATAAAIDSCKDDLQLSKKIKIAIDVLKGINKSIGFIESCTNFFQPEVPSMLGVGTIGSFDPNDKLGPNGFGDARFVNGRNVFNYIVRFENLESATAPAQTITVTDSLDVQSFDLASLKLGPISIGERRLVPQSGSQVVATEVDLRPDRNEVVRISGQINAANNLVWRFETLDPDTGLPHQDPFAGFLPPNVNPPEGEGSVIFSIDTVDGLATGVEISNSAEIVFDNNEPIVTPVWRNSVDVDLPSSTVSSLAPVQNSETFLVSWTGNDVGSGVLDFSIFVSTDGVTYQPWLVQTTAASEIFVGESGITYHFYSLVRDLARNIESAPSVADAITEVVLTVAPPPPPPPPPRKTGGGVIDIYLLTLLLGAAAIRRMQLCREV